MQTMLHGFKSHLTKLHAMAIPFQRKGKTKVSLVQCSGATAVPFNQSSLHQVFWSAPNLTFSQLGHLEGAQSRTAVPLSRIKPVQESNYDASGLANWEETLG